MKSIAFLVAAALVASAAPAGACPEKAVQRAEPKAPLTHLFTKSDYPPAALANGEQGRVAYRIDIAANGRVSGCTITGSSGSAALDTATCRILRSRARFTPARDAAGAPTADSLEGVIPWRLEASQPAGA